MFPFTFQGRFRLPRSGHSTPVILRELRAEFEKIGIEQFEPGPDRLKIPLQFVLNHPHATFRNNMIGAFNECEIVVEQVEPGPRLQYSISFVPMFAMALIPLPLLILAGIPGGLRGLLIFAGIIGLFFTGFYVRTIAHYLFRFWRLTHRLRKL